MEKKVIITGVSGLLGNNLAYYLRHQYDILGIYNSHPVLIDGVDVECVDLLSESAFAKCVERFCPDIVIHCASLTNVDYCELNRELAKKTNVDATENVVKSIRGSKTKLIYISTDSVYDGNKGQYVEDDIVSPRNYYGITKHEGELISLKHDNTLVLRTNIFGWNIQNKFSLSEWILSELERKCEIKCFTDAKFSTIYTFEFAKILASCLRKNISGVYNCGSRDSLTKYEFALQIADYFNLDKGLIHPISIEDYNFKAKRGKNLSLNVDKLTNCLDYYHPKVEDCVEFCYQDYKCGLPAKIKKGGMLPGETKSKIIPYGKQYIDDQDINEVIKVLKSTNLTQGPKVLEFESDLCEYTGARYAIAVNSGTAALHLACIAAEVKEGDEVITSPNTFVASANCVAYCGARPVFADIDPGTYNIAPAEVERVLTNKTKAIIPVHFAGQSCDMEGINRLKTDAEMRYGHRIFVIEDACHALGSLYKGNKVGSGVFSDMTVLSFHPVKHITTGEGGAILTNDEKLYRIMKRYRTHGITSDRQEFVGKRYGEDLGWDPWYYEQVDLGFNYRITDIQCALGVSQLKKLAHFSKRRREIVKQYNKCFQDLKTVKVPYESPDCVSNFHLYVLLFEFDNIKIARAEFMAHLRESGIQTQVHYIPVHTQPYYQKRYGYKWGDYPNAENYYQKCLSLPLYSAMSDDDISRVVREVTKPINSKLVWR